MTSLLTKLWEPSSGDPVRIVFSLTNDGPDIVRAINADGTEAELSDADRNDFVIDIQCEEFVP